METIMKGIHWVASFFGMDVSIPDVVNHDMSSYDETYLCDIWDEELPPLDDDVSSYLYDIWDEELSPIVDDEEAL